MKIRLLWLASLCWPAPIRHFAPAEFISRIRSRSFVCWASALRSLSVEGHIGYFWVTQKQMDRCEAKEEDCEGLVNYVLSIGGVEAAAFLRELPDGRYRVSLRSKGKIDVARVAECFGGGGHECASGCSLDGPLADAVRQVSFSFGADLPYNSLDYQ